MKISNCHQKIHTVKLLKENIQKAYLTKVYPGYRENLIHSIYFGFRAQLMMLGDHMERWRLNLGQPNARQISYLLFYCSGPE